MLAAAAAVSSVFALDPNRRITQYGHTAWRVLDGYFAAPTAITQTTDGYVWLGTRDGVLRFDGVKFTPLTLPEGQSLPTSGVSWLLGATDGSLWIGTTGGIARYKDGQLNDFAALRSQGGVGAIIEDETGAVWFTRYRISPGFGPLCRIKENELRCFGKEDGLPVNYGQGLAKDAAGNFWIASAQLCRWREAESAEIFLEKELERTAGDGVNTVAIGSAGQIWAALDATGKGLGVRYYSGGKWSSYTVPGFDGATVRAFSLYRDRNDSLWVGSINNGLYRIHDGVADHYGMENGLSGNSAENIYEDREGNVWVLTDSGIDMFRDTAVVNFSTNEGLSSTGMYSILALENNSVWIGTRGAVDIIQTSAGGSSLITTLKGLPADGVRAMHEDRAGRVWMTVGKKLVAYEKNRFLEVKKQDGSFLGSEEIAESIVSANDGDVWAIMANDKQRRLLRIKDYIVREEIRLDDFTTRAQNLAADRDGGIWIASARDKLTRYREGQTETVTLGNAEEIIIYSLLFDSEDSLWAATNKGMFRWKNGVLSRLDSQSGLPCSVFYSALEDDSGNFWLYAKCGLLEIPASSVAAWREQPESKVSFKIFDALDGALPGPGALYQPRATKSKDGRLWFLNGKSAQMIDPSVSYSDKIQPPVYIEGLTADRQSYPIQSQVNLPPLRGELQIDYTALSYAVPQKVNFRYKLEGHEENWHDAGTRRQAFYNDLAPGQYRFRVIASGSDGVWNETGATLDFTVKPTWYQTTVFRFSCLLLAGLIAWGLYRLRIKQISKVINARFDERLAERTRLARELHDTFLQTIQGSKLVADDALEKPDDPVQMRHTVERLSRWLGQATDEGRAALNSLRTTTVETNDLAEAFRRATEDCCLKESAEVKFSVVGEAKQMHPIVRDEIYRIGYEAIRNACQHSKASQLIVELGYGQDIIIRIKDNGGGIDPVVTEEGKPEHFGLKGMRERAARIGAKLTITSAPNSGTEVTLIVPGAFVFRKPDDATPRKI